MTGVDELSGAALVPYAIGDPGRAAREVVPRLPRDATFPADLRADGGAAGPLTVRAASRRGLLHAYDGSPRQDDYALWVDDRWLVIVVADGVSAAPFSHQAAELVCRNGVALMQRILGRIRSLGAIPWEQVVEFLADALVDHGRRLLDPGAPPPTREQVARQLATTVGITVLDQRPQLGGHHEGVYITVGDTAVYAVDELHHWTRLSVGKRDRRGAASNATAALPVASREDIEAGPLHLRRGGALFIMTDGLADPLGAGDGAVGGHLAHLWTKPPDPLTFCAQVGFARRTFDDDRTAVGVWASPRRRPTEPT